MGSGRVGSDRIAPTIRDAALRNARAGLDYCAKGQGCMFLGRLLTEDDHLTLKKITSIYRVYVRNVNDVRVCVRAYNSASVFAWLTN